MGDRLRILAADDNEMMREFLRKSLTQLGHDVLVVPDGGALVGACRTITPDVVLSDVDMPELDGIAAAGLIRRWSSVPIVLLSGVWDVETRERALQAGATRCIAKPVRPLELVAVVEAVRDSVRPAPPVPALVQWFVETLAEYAVFTLDPHGRVTSWNQGATQWLGYSAAEVVGRPWAVCFAPEECSEDVLLSARDGRAEWTCWCVTREGVRTLASVVVAALRDPEGQVCGYGVIARELESDGDTLPCSTRSRPGECVSGSKVLDTSSGRQTATSPLSGSGGLTNRD